MTRQRGEGTFRQTARPSGAGGNSSDHPFDQRVLTLIQTIPTGKVATYQHVAQLLGTRGYRAVGQALRRNPHHITIPCHRVVRADGRVGGYAGRMDGTRKVRLLRKEGVQIQHGRINLQVYGWES